MLVISPVICRYLLAQSRLEGVPGGLCLEELLGEALARLVGFPQVHLQLRRASSESLPSTSFLVRSSVAFTASSSLLESAAAASAASTRRDSR